MSKESYYAQWMNKNASAKLAPKLAAEEYPYNSIEYGPIPAQFFQNKSVQEKIERLSKSNNVSLNNKKRLPTKESAPYFTKENIKAYLETLSTSFNINGYKTYFAPSQPKAIFYETGNVPNSYEFKVHLMFNVKYLFYVLHALFNFIIAPNVGRFPFVFKLLNYTHVRTIPGEGGMIIPMIDTMTIPNVVYGTNNTEKKKYGRLAESFIYSPSEIKKYPAAYKNKTNRSKLSHIYDLVASTRKNKIIINEPHEFEILFDPVIVFYINDREYAMTLIRMLKNTFPDEYTKDIVLSNYYPRANIKINNMIYLANGDYNTKYGKLACTSNPKTGIQCMPSPFERKIGDLPVEYEEIQDSCSTHAEETQCNAANRFPMAISNHKLCKWKSDKCIPNRTYSSHLLLDNYNSLEQLYNAIGQKEAFDEMKKKAEEGILPVNYNNVNQNQNNKNNENDNTNPLHILSKRTEDNKEIHNQLYRAPPITGYIPGPFHRKPHIRFNNVPKFSDPFEKINIEVHGGRKTRRNKKNKNKSRRRAH